MGYIKKGVEGNLTKRSIAYMLILAMFCLFLCWKGQAAEISISENKKGNVETRNGVWQENLYAKYEKALYSNDMQREESFILSENGWKQNEGGYYECIRETPYSMGHYMKLGDEKQETKGLLAAQAGAEKIKVMRIAIDDTYRWTEYEYFDSGELVYLSYYGARLEDNLPTYWVCIYELYGRVFSSERDTDDWAKMVEEYMGEASISERAKQEYLLVDKHIYAIDRKGRMLKDVTEESIHYAADWLVRTADRIFYGNKVTEEAVNTVSHLASPPYEWIDGYSTLVASDLNNDGIDDYIVRLLKPDITIYSQWHTWTKDNLRMYLSDTEKGYKETTLLGEEYMQRYNIYDMYFVSEDILVCKNSPYGGGDGQQRTVYFRFDPKTEEFYFIGEMECTPENYFYIRGKEEGEYTLKEYYEAREGWVRYAAEREFSESEIYCIRTEDEQKLLAYCDRILANMELANQDNVAGTLIDCINNLVQDAGAVTVSEIVYVGGCADDLKLGDEEKKEGNVIGGKMTASGRVSYLNPALVCGRAEMLDSPYWYVDFIIDRKNGKPVYIQDIISKEDMLRICREGMQDKFGNAIGKDETEYCLSWIDEGFENANSWKPKSIYEEKGLLISFSVDEWGLLVTFEVEKDKRNGMKIYEVRLDKEYFIDTSLWKYWEGASLWVTDEDLVYKDE